MKIYKKRKKITKILQKNAIFMLIFMIFGQKFNF